MRMSGPGKSCQSFTRDTMFGPRGAFAVSMISGAAVWGVAGHLLPQGLVMPVVVTLLFVLAAIFALVAWVRCMTDEYRVSYWDVSGAIVLIGICASALIDPDDFVRLVAIAHSEN